MDSRNTYHDRWLANTQRMGVPADVAAEVARRHGISPENFGILERSEEISDPNAKSFFLLPRDVGSEDARKAAVMTYVFNAGTGYGRSGGQCTDFPETPYSAAEVQRITERQDANSWSYLRDVRFVHRNGARLAATPNGILMGMGGNWIQRQFSRQGGTAWGDIFMVNISGGDPAKLLRQVIHSGHAWCADGCGRPVETTLELDRVLHHEEIHSRQWAAKGYPRMIREYSWEAIRQRAFGKPNRLEVEAGPSDGGYRADNPL